MRNVSVSKSPRDGELLHDLRAHGRPTRAALPRCCRDRVHLGNGSPDAAGRCPRGLFGASDARCAGRNSRSGSRRGHGRFRSEGAAEVAVLGAKHATQLDALSDNDVRSLHLAWDEAASCPAGAGPPAVGVIRPDLSLQRGFRLLPERARLVFLTLAAEAGHRAIRADAQSLALRTGLDVPTTCLAIRHLIEARWLSAAPDLGLRVVIVTHLAFPALSAGGWRMRPAR